MKIFFAGSIRSGRKLLLGCEAHGNMAVNVLLTLLVSIIWNELFSHFLQLTACILWIGQKRSAVSMECAVLDLTACLIKGFWIADCYHQLLPPFLRQ